MEEEELEQLRHEYESSVVNHKEAVRIYSEKKAIAEQAAIDRDKAQKNVGITRDDTITKRKIYEDALYVFYEETNS